MVQVRVPQHEILCSVTHLSAILKKPNVVGVGVLATFFQAVVDCVNDDVVALAACVNARVHFGSLMFVDVWHLVPFV